MLPKYISTGGHYCKVLTFKNITWHLIQDTWVVVVIVTAVKLVVVIVKVLVVVVALVAYIVVVQVVLAVVKVASDEIDPDSWDFKMLSSTL